MNKKLTTLLLAFLIMIIGKSEAATLTQKLGESAISATVNAGQEVTLIFNNRTNYTFKKWTVEKGNVTVNTTSKTVTFIMPNENVVIRANYEEETPTVTEYTLTYNANGGSGAPSNQTGTTLTISNTTPTRSGYTFKGWAKSSSATTASYSAGGSITLSANTTLYAVWEQNTKTITLTYNANGGKNAPSTQTVTTTKDSYIFTISNTTPTKSGYTFKGWSTSSSATTASYSAGKSITLSENTTLYAVWEQAYILTYNANGGSGAPSSQTGTTLTISSIIPTKEAYTFKGWSESRGTTASYSAGESITLTADTTLYAVWEVVETTFARDYRWYKGTTDASTITEIEIVDSYTPTGSETESWNADVGNTGAIKCYIEGTKLIIAGNGKGQIYANADSSFMFGYNANPPYAGGNDFSKVTSITGINLLNTSNVTDMTYMFCGCSSLRSLDVRGFDTSKVGDMDFMFDDCSSLTSLDVSNFDTSNVTSMTYMFYRCSSLRSLDVSGFDTSKVWFIGGMFKGCSSLTSIDVSRFNTREVSDMSSMFEGCSSLTSIDVSSFNTSKVRDMSSMFEGCSSITSIDVSSFNTSIVTDMSGMFWSCSSLTSLDLSKFNTSRVTNMGVMFSGCSSLESLDLSKFNTSKVTDMESMFKYCDKLAQIKLGENFSFTGDGSTSCTLPTPSSGYWYTADGTAYLPADVPSNVAATYYAVKP